MAVSAPKGKWTALTVVEFTMPITPKFVHVPEEQTSERRDKIEATRLIPQVQL